MPLIRLRGLSFEKAYASRPDAGGAYPYTQPVRIIGYRQLDAFSRKHRDAAAPLARWCREVAAVEWSGPQAIREMFAAASFRPSNRVIFNLKGNAYRLVVRVNFPLQQVIVEWIGTHAEYNRLDL